MVDVTLPTSILGSVSSVSAVFILREVFKFVNQRRPGNGNGHGNGSNGAHVRQLEISEETVALLREIRDMNFKSINNLSMAMERQVEMRKVVDRIDGKVK